MKETFTTISSRVDFKFVEFAKENSGRGKRFKDISACVRYYLDLGQKTESLMKIRKIPERQQELDSKLTHLMNKEKVENVIETMDEEELDSILFLANNAKKQKIQMIIDLVNKN